MFADGGLVGYPVPWDWIATNVKRAQDYLVHNTTLGIPALVQTEGKSQCFTLHEPDDILTME